MSSEKQQLEQQIIEIKAKIRAFEEKYPDTIKEMNEFEDLAEYKQQKQEELDHLVNEINEERSKSQAPKTIQDKNQQEQLIKEKESQVKQFEETLNFLKLHQELFELQKKMRGIDNKVNSDGKPKVEVDDNAPHISSTPKTQPGNPSRPEQLALAKLKSAGWTEEAQKDGTKIYTAPEKNSKNQDIKFEVKGNSINIGKDVEYDKKVGDMMVELAAAKLATSKNIVVFHPDPAEAKRLADSLKLALSKYNSDAKISITNDHKEYMDYIKNGIPPEKTQPKSEADLTITTQPKPIEKVEKTEMEQLGTEPSDNQKEEPVNKTRGRSKTF